jgi:hypothetical protein
MKISRNQRTQAFTRLEVLIVIVVASFVVAVFLTPSRRQANLNRRIQCANNLKCVGIAFRIWSGDCGDRYSMGVSVKQGGTAEFIGTPETFRHFQIMSNELCIPRILVCPADPQRIRADSFREFGNTNVSYFVGVDAQDIYPQSFLIGDRNLTNGQPLHQSMLALTTNQPVGWTADIHGGFGNVGLGDGGVKGWTSPALKRGLSDSGYATNRVAMP